MKMTPLETYRKALYAGKRLPELEDIILTDPNISFQYAADIIKGRWIEAEDIIMLDPLGGYLYAVNVIKGKLPDKMHNMMLLYAIKNLDNWAKNYFEYLKYLRRADHGRH